MPLDLEEFQIENVTLSEKVYELLKGYILQGKLAAGEKLDIFELSKILNVSRTPIKEAFNRLSANGLVMIYPNRGTFVRELPNVEGVRNIFDARLMVELWCFEQVCRNPEAVKKAEESAQNCYPLFASTPENFDYTAFFQHDMAFHYTFIGVARNPEIVKMYNMLALSIQIMRIYWGRAYGRALVSYQEHLEVIEALREGDYSKTKMALRSHIENVRDDMISILNRD